MTIASDYRHSISITLQTATSQGVRGQDTYSTSTIGTFFAKIEALSGRKQEIARQIVASATHEITIRYLAGVTPECKVVFGSRSFTIGSVLNRMENNFELVLTCTEVV